MAQQLNVNLALTADTSNAKAQLQSLQKQLTDLTKIANKSTDLGFSKSIKESTTLIAQLKAQLDSATTSAGNLDLSKFNDSLKSSNTTITQYKDALTNLGPEGEQAFAQLANSVNNAEIPMKRAGKLLDDFAVTLKNTAKWQISSDIMHGFQGALQSAFGYAQDLNESLTNIQIVTGQTTSQMAQFAEQANKSAQALSTTTTAYTDAALIFYQQGLSGSEVTDRTDVVIKMAQATGDSATEVSSYMTAIWNNFDDGSESLEHYSDVITALGAATASSSSEIAEGLSKFSSVAETAGLSYEYATSALATVVAKTRESADTVGNAFKTIFARIQDLELGETLDDGTDLGTYSQALEKVGVDIKDASGELKDMDTILDELGGKWKTLSNDTQLAVAQAVAGTRQYTQLMALMNNWDYMQENLAVAEDSEGTLEEQASTYADSWEAAQNRVTAAAEAIYDSLIDDQFFITLDNLLADLLKGVNDLIKGLGGIPGVLGTIGSIATNVFSKQIASGLNNVAYDIKMLTKSGREEVENLRKQASTSLISSIRDKATKSSGTQADIYTAEADAKKALYESAEKLNEVEQKTAQNLADQVTALKEEAQAKIDIEKAATSDRKQNEKAIENVVTSNDTSGEGSSIFSAFKDTTSIYTQQQSYIDSLNSQLHSLGENGVESIQNIKDAMDGFQDRLETAGIKLEEMPKDFQELYKKVQDFVNSNGTTGSFDDILKNFDDVASGIEIEIETFVNEFKDEFVESLGLSGEEAVKCKDKIDAFVKSLQNEKTAHLDVEDAVVIQQNAVKNLKDYLTQARDSSLSFGETMTSAARGITALTSEMNAIKGLGDVFTSDASGLDKFVSIASTAATTIPTLISGLKALSAVAGGPVTAILAIGSAVIGVFKAVKEAEENNISKLEEQAEKSKEIADEAYEQATQDKEVLKTYQDALTAYDKVSGDGKEALVEASQAVTEAYEIENAQLLIATERYEELAEAVKNARAEEASKNKADIGNALTDAEDAFESRMRGNPFDDNYFTTNLQGKDVYQANFYGITDLADPDSYNYDTGAYGYDELNSALDEIDEKYRDLIKVDPWGRLTIETAQSSDGLISAYEAAEALRDSLYNMGEDARESDAYKNVNEYLQTMQEDYENLIDLKKEYTDTAVETDFQTVLDNYTGDTDFSNITNLDNFIDSAAKSISEMEDGKVSIDDAKESLLSYMSTYSDYSDLVQESELVKETADQYNFDQDKLKTWYDQQQDDAIDNFSDLYVKLNFEIVNDDTLSDDLDAQIKVLQAQADADTIKINYETSDTALSDFKSGMTADEYKKFQSSSGLDWGQTVEGLEDPIIQYSEFLKMSESEQAQYLTDINKKLYDSYNESASTAEKADSEYISYLQSRQTELQDIIGDFNEADKETARQSFNGTDEEFQSFWDEKVAEVEAAKEELDAIDEEIAEYQSDSDSRSSDIEINAILKDQELNEQLNDLQSTEYKIGVTLDVDNISALQELFGNDWAKELQDYVQIGVDGSYELVKNADEFNDKVQQAYLSSIASDMEMPDVKNYPTNTDAYNQAITEYQTEYAQNLAKIKAGLVAIKDDDTFDNQLEYYKDLLGLSDEWATNVKDARDAQDSTKDTIENLNRYLEEGNITSSEFVTRLNNLLNNDSSLTTEEKIKAINDALDQGKYTAEQYQSELETILSDSGYTSQKKIEAIDNSKLTDTQKRSEKENVYTNASDISDTAKISGLEGLKVSDSTEEDLSRINQEILDIIDSSSELSDSEKLEKLLATDWDEATKSSEKHKNTMLDILSGDTNLTLSEKIEKINKTIAGGTDDAIKYGGIIADILYSDKNSTTQEKLEALSNALDKVQITSEDASNTISSMISNNQISLEELKNFYSENTQLTDYTDKVKELAASYDYCTESLQKYKDALEEGNEEAISATEKALELSIKVAENAEKFSIDANVIEAFIENLSSMEEYADASADEIVRLGTAFARANEGLNDLCDNSDTYQDILDEIVDNGYAQAITQDTSNTKKFITSLANLLNTSESVAKSLLKDQKNADALSGALQGNTDDIKTLDKEARKLAAIEIGVDVDQIEGGGEALDSLLDKMDEIPEGKEILVELNGDEEATSALQGLIQELWNSSDSIDDFNNNLAQLDLFGDLAAVAEDNMGGMIDGVYQSAEEMAAAGYVLISNANGITEGLSSALSLETDVGSMTDNIQTEGETETPASFYPEENGEQTINVPGAAFSSNGESFDFTKTDGATLTYKGIRWTTGDTQTESIEDQTPVTQVWVRPRKGGGAGTATHGNRNVNGGGRRSSGSRGSRGSGSRGSTTRKNSAEKKTASAERYHKVDKTLSTLEKQYDAISKAKDRAFGKSKLKNLQEELKTQQAIVKTQAEYLKQANDYLKQDKKKLNKTGTTTVNVDGTDYKLNASAEGYLGMKVKYDDNNNISNYDELMAANDKKLEAARKAYTSANSDDDAAKVAWEKAQAQYEAFQQFLSQYEETVETVQEKQQDLQDSENEAYDLLVEITDTKLELKLEVNEEDLKLLDYYLGKLGDDIYDIAEAITLLTQEADVSLSNIDATTQHMEDTYKTALEQAGVKNVDKKVQKLMNGETLSDSDMEKLASTLTDDQKESLKDDTAKLLEENNNLLEIQASIYEDIGKAFDANDEKLDKQINKLQRLSKVTDTYKNLIDIYGQKNLGVSNDTMNKLYETQRKQAKNEYDALVSKKEMQESEIKKMEEAKQQLIDMGYKENSTNVKELQEQIDAANEALESTEDSIEDAKTSIAELTVAQFTQEITAAVDAFKESCGGLAGSIDELQTAFERSKDIADEYIPEYEKVYELTKLTRKINNSIDDTSNIKAKKELNKLLEEINEKQESGVQMSEYELEYLQKKYDLKVAELALSEAQNAKSQVRLTQDAEGNYGYVYTADDSQVEDAEQNYEDKLYEMQQLNAEYINTLQEQMIQLQQEEADALASLAEEYQDDVEGFNKAAAELQAYYAEKNRYTSEQMGIVIENNKELYEDDVASYAAATGNKALADEEYISSFSDTQISMLTGYKNMEEYQDNYTESAKDMYLTAANASAEYASNIKDDLTQMGYDAERFDEEMSEALDSVQEESDFLKGSISETATQAENDFDGIMEKVTTFQSQYSQVISDILQKNEALVESFNKLLKSWNAVESKDTDEVKTNTSGTGNATDNDNSSQGENGASGTGTKPTWDRIMSAYNRINSGAWGNGVSHRITMGAKEGYTKAEVTAAQTYINYVYPVSERGKGYSSAKAKSLMGYDTGGYTGDWGDNEGKLALLHKKEIVLNKEDTENFLNAIDMVREISNMIDLNAVSASGGLGQILAASVGNSSNQTLEQEVHITAEFPNATDKNEILEAFDNVINLASQYANRSK
jgi:TP901 family phage tail tape measure protein